MIIDLLYSDFWLSQFDYPNYKTRVLLRDNFIYYMFRESCI